MMSHLNIVQPVEPTPAGATARKKGLAKRLLVPTLILVGGLSQIAWVVFLAWCLAWLVGLA